MCWVVLLCTWGCLRLSDLEGLDPSRIALGSRGLRGVLVRTKTTGPGKQVKETPVFVSRRISVSGHDWMRCGFNIWQEFGNTSRDYFVMTTDAKMEKCPDREGGSLREAGLPGLELTGQTTAPTLEAP